MSNGNVSRKGHCRVSDIGVGRRSCCAIGEEVRYENDLGSVRSSQVKAIAQALKEIGVSGCTVYPVRGYGEEWHVYEPLVHGGHHKLEAVFEGVCRVSCRQEITEPGRQGLKGDGLLSVFGLNKVVHLRTRGALT